MTHTESAEERDYYAAERRYEANPIEDYAFCKACEALVDSVELDEGNGLCRQCETEGDDQRSEDEHIYQQELARQLR